MALTPSTMLPLGTVAADFALSDRAGKVVRAADFPNKPLLVMFICNHCPFVVHIRTHLAATCKEFQAKGLSVVAINSNDATAYPADSPEKMTEESNKFDSPGRRAEARVGRESSARLARDS